MTIRHETVPARDLRDGDLMRLGVSTTYVLVAKAEIVGGQVAVTIYDGTVPRSAPTIRLRPNASAALSMRNAPADGGAR